MPKLFSAFSTADVPTSIRRQIESLLASWQAKRLDGQVTVPEFVLFAQECIATAMSIVNGLADDATKKAIVLEVAGELFDHFAPLIIGAIPGGRFALFIAWLFGITPANQREKFLLAVSWMIEAIYERKFARAA